MQRAEIYAYLVFAGILTLLWIGSLVLRVMLWLPFVLSVLAVLLVMARIVYFSVRQD